MMRGFSAWILGVAGILGACELAFRLLPVSTATETGYYADQLILTYPAHHRWTMSTGWDLRNAQTLVANNAGFPAERDFFRDEKAVALIGDSYVEASMLKPIDRPGAQLEASLVGRPVYAMGGPGSSLLDYAERIRYASKTFGIKDFVVVMEQFDVQQALCGSENVHGACLDAKTLEPKTITRPAPSWFKRVFRHSQFAQYWASQVKLDAQQLKQGFRTQLAGAEAKPAAGASTMAGFAGGVEKAQLDAVTKTFFHRVASYDVNKLVIVFDCARAVRCDQKSEASGYRQQFLLAAKQAGAEIVDAAALFPAHWNHSALSLSVGPYDGHLNQLGLQILLRSAARKLQPKADAD